MPEYLYEPNPLTARSPAPRLLCLYLHSNIVHLGIILGIISGYCHGMGTGWGNLGLRSSFTILWVILFVSGLAAAQTELSGEALLKPAKESTEKLNQLPSTYDDQQNENILTHLVNEAGFFPNLKVKVTKGLVTVEGEVKDQSQLDWLVQTADRLPSVVAVINKAKITKPAVSDLSPVRDELISWSEQIKKSLPGILAGLALIVIFYFVVGRLNSLFMKMWSYRIKNYFLLSIATKLSLLPVYLILFYLVLLTMGLKGLAATIIGGTGVLGLVLGLAFKGIAENYFAGILLAMRSPFTKGDNIQVGEIKGIVQNLNMRGTTLMDQDGTLILIPNLTVINSIVQNTSANPQTRTSFTIGIGYENSVVEAQKVLLSVLEKSDRVLQDPKPLVLVDDLGSSSVNIKVYFWFDSTNASLVGMRSRVIAACKDALLQADITMPDGNREIIFRDPLKISMLKKQDDSSGKIHREAKINASDEQEIESTHDDMMQGTNPEQDVKEMAKQVSLPGNSQSPDLLK